MSVLELDEVSGAPAPIDVEVQQTRELRGWVRWMRWSSLFWSHKARTPRAPRHAA
jgi:hypothetical protein